MSMLHAYTGTVLSLCTLRAYAHQCCDLRQGLKVKYAFVHSPVNVGSEHWMLSCDDAVFSRVPVFLANFHRWYMKP